MAAPIMPWTLAMLRARVQFRCQTAAQRRAQEAQAYYQTAADHVDFEGVRTRSYSCPPTFCALRFGWNVYPLYHYQLPLADDEELVQ